MLLGIVQATVAIFALFYFIPAYAAPHTVKAGPQTDREVQAMSRCQRWGFYALLFFRWLGLFVIFYHASGALTSWVPDWWGGTDEDGDWRSIRNGIDMFISFWGSVAVMASVEDRIERAAKQPVDHATLMALLKALDTKPRDTFQRDRALSDAEFVLKDRVMGKLWKETEYRDQMLKRLEEIRTRRP